MNGSKNPAVNDAAEEHLMITLLGESAQLRKILDGREFEHGLTERDEEAFHEGPGERVLVEKWPAGELNEEPGQLRLPAAGVGSPPDFAHDGGGRPAQVPFPVMREVSSAR